MRPSSSSTSARPPRAPKSCNLGHASGSMARSAVVAVAATAGAVPRVVVGVVAAHHPTAATAAARRSSTPPPPPPPPPPPSCSAAAALVAAAVAAPSSWRSAVRVACRSLASSEEAASTPAFAAAPLAALSASAAGNGGASAVDSSVAAEGAAATAAADAKSVWHSVSAVVTEEAEATSSSSSDGSAASVAADPEQLQPEQQPQQPQPQQPRRRQARRHIKLASGASLLPHPDKAHRGGEDAFFIADPPRALGVADGVGGWAELGIDAGAYARLLMAHAKEEAETKLAAASGSSSSGGGGDDDAYEDDDDEDDLCPQVLLEKAYHRTNVHGSSTACVLALNGSTLSVSNLGDSGFLLVRGGQAAFQSPQQQHNFNFPLQLAWSGSGGGSDPPGAAMRFELALRPGDILVAGTDGLWDNVFADEAAAVVARCRAQGDSPEEAAHTLCRYARMRATDPKHRSPFSYAAVQAGYLFIGGKLDDITVLVSYVGEEEEADTETEAEAGSDGGNGGNGGSA